MSQSQVAQRAGPQESARLMRLATYASVSVALILIVAKLIAWQQSGSVSLLATLVLSFCAASSRTTFPTLFRSERVSE